MKPEMLRQERLRSHRLSAPARSVADAAQHMLAVQAQEFWAGRWALASRTAGTPTVSAVDGLFDRGVLVRAWTQRGTLHIVPAQDLAWMLQVTGARQMRAQEPRLRELGLDAEALKRVEHVVRTALRGGNALTRAELFDLFVGIGIDPAGQRGAHAIGALALRGIICQGPTVARPGGVSREQYFVLFDEHIRESASPVDPAAEMFARYIGGHGPATAADFAWWAGLTLTAARAAASAAQNDERIHEVDDGLFAASNRPRRSPRAASVLTLASFEEYYISYADRTVACPPEHLAAVGPGKNGMVRPIIVRDGVVIGTWRQSTAIGRHAEDPIPELLTPGAADAADIGAALDRYAAFITG